jgi:hypothetical protein
MKSYPSKFFFTFFFARFLVEGVTAEVLTAALDDGVSAFDANCKVAVWFSFSNIVRPSEAV